MGINDSLDDSQTEAGTGWLGREERFEYPLRILWRYAAALIGYFDARPITRIDQKAQ